MVQCSFSLFFIFFHGLFLVYPCWHEYFPVDMQFLLQMKCLSLWICYCYNDIMVMQCWESVWQNFIQWSLHWINQFLVSCPPSLSENALIHSPYGRLLVLRLGRYSVVTTDSLTAIRYFGWMVMFERSNPDTLPFREILLSLIFAGLVATHFCDNSYVTGGCKLHAYRRWSMSSLKGGASVWIPSGTRGQLGA